MAESKSLFENLVETLENQIKDAAQRYYTAGNSLYTDSEFDAMVDHLKEIAPNSPVLTTGWGYDVWKNTAGEKYQHLYGLAGSLDKIHNWKELPDRFKNEQVYASLKLDGLSCVMYFRNGKLYRALTRGDGTTGIDITEKVHKILGFKEIDDNTFTGAVRGEIIMSWRKFEDYQLIHPEAKHPRNTAAGLINMKEISSDINFLDIVVYTIVGDEGFNTSNTNMLHMNYVISWLNQQFGKVAPYAVLNVSRDSFDESMRDLQAGWLVDSDMNPLEDCYPSDGIVITKSQPDINLDTHYITYDSVAYKFPPEEKETIVESVEWNLTKTRYLVPKVKIHPVEIDGVTVTYVTGYNAQYIKDNDIGQGTIVTIARMGEVIPNIVTVKNSTSAVVPKYCPECGEFLEWNGVHLQCTNPACGNAVLQDTLWWLNHLVPLDNFGDKLRVKFLKQFYNDNLSIENIMEHQIYPKPNPLFGSQYKLFCTMMDKLYHDNFKLADAISALNIPRFGDITCSKLAKYPDWVAQIYRVAEGYGTINTLWGLRDIIGNANAVSIIDNIEKFKRLKYIKSRIVIDDVEQKGKVAITGKLSVKRSAFEKELRDHGYEPVSSVTKDTKFLITDDPNSSSSKNKSADKFGIQKITEHEFRDKYLR